MGLLAIFVATVVAIFFGWGGVEVINELSSSSIDNFLLVLLKVVWVLAVVVAWAAFVLGYWRPLPTRRRS